MPRTSTIGRLRRSRTSAAVIAGALVLAACSGGGESRTRNAALDANSDCFATQAAKDAALGSLEDRIREAQAAAAEYDRLSAEAKELGDRAAALYTAMMSTAVGQRGNSETDEEWAEYLAAQEVWDKALQESKQADAKAYEAKERAATLSLREDEVVSVNATPVCAGGEESAAPDTSDPTQTSAPTESTDTSVAPDDTASADDGGTSASSATCTAYPEQGTDLVVAVGEGIDLSFVLCDGADGLRVSGPKGVNKTLGFKRSMPNKFTLVGKIAGTTRVSVRQVNRSTTPVTVLSDAVRINVTVVEPQPDDACNGKRPEMAWYDDDDRLVGIATCEPIDHIRVSVLKGEPGQPLPQVYFGRLTSNVPVNNAVSYFGPGTYVVSMAHVRIVDGVEQIVGEAGNMTVVIPDTSPSEPDGAPDDSESTGTSEPGVVSNGGVINDRLPDGVVSVPAFAMTPVSPDAPPSAASDVSTVPVVAVASGTTTLVCGATCLAAVGERAGVEDGTVEIAVGDAPWSTVTATSAFALPAGVASVKVRVTPAEGEAREFEVAVVRESVDSVYSDDATEDETAEVTAALVTESSDSGFPAWAVLLIVVLVLAAGGVVARRRMQARSVRN